MGVRIDIGLDFEGNHTFAYEPCEGPRALEVPEAVLRRWAAERHAFAQARRRWQAVVAEIDAYLLAAQKSEDATGLGCVVKPSELAEGAGAS